MATYTKFLDYVEQLNKAVHNWSSHTFKAALTNTAPVNTNTVFANLTEISAGNGYTAGGTGATISSSAQTSGTYKLVIADLTLTASGGSVAPFRYVVIYNDTATNDELIGFYDYGSDLTLANGESLLIDFSAANGMIQLS